MGPSELLGGFAGENSEKRPSMNAFPQVRNIRYEILPPKTAQKFRDDVKFGAHFLQKDPEDGEARHRRRKRQTSSAGNGR